MIDKIRYKLFPNNKQCQTGAGLGWGGGHGEVAAAVPGAALADMLAYRGRERLMILGERNKSRKEIKWRFGSPYPPSAVTAFGMLCYFSFLNTGSPV